MDSFFWRDPEAEGWAVGLLTPSLYPMKVGWVGSDRQE